MRTQKEDARISRLFLCVVFFALSRLSLSFSLPVFPGWVPSPSPQWDDDETPHRDNDIYKRLSNGCPPDLIPPQHSSLRDEHPREEKQHQVQTQTDRQVCQFQGYTRRDRLVSTPADIQQEQKQTGTNTLPRVNTGLHKVKKAFLIREQYDRRFTADMLQTKNACQQVVHYTTCRW